MKQITTRKELNVPYYMAGKETHLVAESVTERYDAIQLRALLMSCVTGLSDAGKDVIALRFGLGLTLKETGAVLGIHWSRVRHRQLRALSRLRHRHFHDLKVFAEKIDKNLYGIYREAIQDNYPW